MRDWLISRQRYWGAPIPIIHCKEHGAVSVPDNELPVILPEVDYFGPTGKDRSVLAGVEEWVNVPCPKCGQPAKRETDTMDGYACSSWYFLRYIDPCNRNQPWDISQANKWMPVDFYNGGDHATAHLLYARFFMRFFHKIGLVNNPEPFERMYYHAKIVASDGTPFSKTLGNGPDPLQLIESGYGADSIRTYIMFMSPPDIESPWNDDGVPGIYRFLNRLWVLTQEFLNDSQQDNSEHAKIIEQKLLTIANQTTKKVSDDIEAIKFNTAISAMMEAVNELYKIKADTGYAPRESWKYTIETLLQLLAPFAPHMCEELWNELGNKGTIHIDNWPTLDKSYLKSNEMKIVVQVNGKVRANITVGPDADKDEVIKTAKNDEIIAKYIEPGIKKEIYVPGKILNFVV